MSPSKNDILRERAIAFYKMMFNDCKAREAIETFAGDEYIQHNPEVGDGKEAFIAYFDRMAEEYPGKSVSVIRSVVEENLVVLHCHQIWPANKSYAGEEYAGIDIFRFDEDMKVVEHWDVLQTLPKSSKNDNGMF